MTIFDLKRLFELFAQPLTIPVRTSTKQAMMHSNTKGTRSHKFFRAFRCKLGPSA